MARQLGPKPDWPLALSGIVGTGYLERRAAGQLRNHNQSYQYDHHQDWAAGSRQARSAAVSIRLGDLRRRHETSETAATPLPSAVELHDRQSLKSKNYFAETA